MIRNFNPFLYLSLSSFLLLFTGHAQSSDSTDNVGLAKSHLQEMDETDMRATWFYTITAHTDGEILVSRNDPTRKEGARRELISVNGESPTEERVDEFRKQEALRRKGRGGKRSQSEFSDMVDFSTLALVEIVNGQALLSFTPVLEGLEKESDKLNGTLRMNADTHMIEALSLVNTAKISPAFSVSFTTFNMSFSFARVDGETLLSRMTTSVEGKAGFLKKFKSSSEITFSDYQRIPLPVKNSPN